MSIKERIIFLPKLYGLCDIFQLLKISREVSALYARLPLLEAGEFLDSLPSPDVLYAPFRVREQYQLALPA